MQFYNSFRSLLSGRDKMFDRDRFQNPVCGIFFIVEYETWKSRGEIRYNFDNT